jgi:hypothetical protein
MAWLMQPACPDGVHYSILGREYEEYGLAHDPSQHGRAQ